MFLLHYIPALKDRAEIQAADPVINSVRSRKQPVLRTYADFLAVANGLNDGSAALKERDHNIRQILRQNDVAGSVGETPSTWILVPQVHNHPRAAIKRKQPDNGVDRATHLRDGPVSLFSYDCVVSVSL